MKRLLTFFTSFILFLLLTSTSAFASSFSDSFTDIDGTTLHTHNSIWNCDNDNSLVAVESNAAVASSGTQNCLANSFTNGSASIDVTTAGVSSDISDAIILRYQSPGNYYQCNLNTNDGFVIFKFVDGTPNVLINNSGTTATGTHNISCDITGSDITLSVDGTVKATATDSTFSSGLAGFQARDIVTSVDNYTSTDTSPAVEIVSSPSTADVSVGTPFNVDVKVNSDSDNAFNAAQATVAVSSNLSITGIHNATSNACNLQYTKHPTPSDPSFAGAIFNGSSAGCTAYTMTLTPTSTGTGTITFTNGSIKAYADNSEILTGVQNGSFTIGDGPTPTPTSGVNQLTITSPLLTYLTDYTLTGGKDSAINHIFINGSDADASFPTDSTWSVPETLSLGDNNYTIYGTDGSGNQTATQTIDVNRHTLGDINGDGVVDLTDASLFAVDWNKTSNLTYILSDMNNDGSVDLTDLSILAKLEL